MFFLFTYFSFQFTRHVANKFLTFPIILPSPNKPCVKLLSNSKTKAFEF